MNKRRLSNQQKRRIASQQQRALETSAMTQDKCNGRIVSHFGRQLQVEVLQGVQKGKLLHCHQRANLPDLVTGDLVLWEQVDDGTGVILAQGQRRNVFIRPDSRGRDKAIAANLDCVLVVMAILPQPFMNLIDRYLVALENLGIPAIVVLNKCDLFRPTQHPDIVTMLSIYDSLGYPVVRVSAESGSGLDALEQTLAGKTTVLVGQSGVGKSSLVNRLGQADLASVGDLSHARAKGTHTTTTARLFHLRQCDLIDSPGIREFRVENLDPGELIRGFRELAPLTGQCRFRNCAHQDEPGCAVRKALEAGPIHPWRWQSYCHMRGSLTGVRG